MTAAAVGHEGPFPPRVPSVKGALLTVLTAPRLLTPRPAEHRRPLTTALGGVPVDLEGPAIELGRGLSGATEHAWRAESLSGGALGSRGSCAPLGRSPLGHRDIKPANAAQACRSSTRLSGGRQPRSSSPRLDDEAQPRCSPPQLADARELVSESRCSSPELVEQEETAASRKLAWALRSSSPQLGEPEDASPSSFRVDEAGRDGALAGRSLPLERGRGLEESTSGPGGGLERGLERADELEPENELAYLDERVRALVAQIDRELEELSELLRVEDEVGEYDEEGPDLAELDRWLDQALCPDEDDEEFEAYLEELQPWPDLPALESTPERAAVEGLFFACSPVRERSRAQLLAILRSRTRVEHVAARCRTTEGEVWRWLRREGLPTLEKRALLADNYGVSADHWRGPVIDDQPAESAEEESAP